MKMKKVLAAVLAGTMVMASALPVFAIGTDEKLEGTTWWTAMQTSSDSVLSGDGTWTVVLTDITTNWDEDTATGGGLGFCVELVGAVDPNPDMANTGKAYITSSSGGGGWMAEDGTGDDADASLDGIQPKGGSSDTWPEYVDGTPVYAEIVREGQNFTIAIYEGETKVVRHIYENTNMPTDVNLHILAQTASFTVNLFEGSAADAMSGSAKAAGSSDATSEVASEATSQATKTTETGDAAPIAAVVVALAGCAVIAFASKKRFA